MARRAPGVALGGRPGGASSAHGEPLALREHRAPRSGVARVDHFSATSPLIGGEQELSLQTTSL